MYRVCETYLPVCYNIYVVGDWTPKPTGEKMTIVAICAIAAVFTLTIAVAQIAATA